jgi:ribonuclease T1
VIHPVAWLRTCAPALLVLAALAVFTALGSTAVQARDEPSAIRVSQLPPEARATLALIRKRGPYPYERDGVVFGNFERRLPIRERGYYQEYTVPTPGVSHRGARRIVVGRQGELYYTADHYRSFRRIVE